MTTTYTRCPKCDNDTNQTCDLRGRNYAFCEECEIFIDKESCEEINRSEMKCAECNLLPTKDGHDPCIADLPGVIFACCGHGNLGQAYVAFADGRTIRHGLWDDKKRSAWNNEICKGHFRIILKAIGKRFKKKHFKYHD
jgi:hypothetical protein